MWEKGPPTSLCCYQHPNTEQCVGAGQHSRTSPQCNTAALGMLQTAAKSTHGVITMFKATSKRRCCPLVSAICQCLPMYVLGSGPRHPHGGQTLGVLPFIFLTAGLHASLSSYLYNHTLTVDTVVFFSNTSPHTKLSYSNIEQILLSAPCNFLPCASQLHPWHIYFKVHTGVT